MITNRFTCLQFKLPPLHYACRGGCVDAVKVLVEEFSVDPNSASVQVAFVMQKKYTDTLFSFSSQTGLKPIHVAVVSGQVDVIATLIDDYGVDPNGYPLSKVNDVFSSCVELPQLNPVT